MFRKEALKNDKQQAGDIPECHRLAEKNLFL